MSKLAVAAETEADRYDYLTRVNCFECAEGDVDKNAGKLPQVVEGVMKANTFSRQEEVKAWEQEVTQCEHTLCLEQQGQRQIPSQDLGQCAMCDLKENLWLCLTCGNLGCGRAQFGGVGGNSHALAHGDASNHPVAVKLGSLTAEGTADVYCYSCNDERTDPELPAHLSHWGINIADRQKTEKSLTEMQIEQNLRWEFSMTNEEGMESKPLFGPGFTGLKNLGNSCYLASVLQCLFDMPEFIERYYHEKDTPPAVANPAEDLETQMSKIADGLRSGRYAKPDHDVAHTQAQSRAHHSGNIDGSKVEDVPPHQRGLAPAMLKHLIGRGHSEFSTMRQQDAFELLLHLLQLISRSKHPASRPNPVNAFRFVMEQRLQCQTCSKVRYRTDEMENVTVPVPIRRIPKTMNGDPDAKMTEAPTDGTAKENRALNAAVPENTSEFEAIPLTGCLDVFTSGSTVELTCPSCAGKSFTKRSLFKTFPAVLAVNVQRFHLVNWLPTKLDVPVIVGDDALDLGVYKSPGPQPGEEALPEDVAEAGFVPDATALAMLEGMGFPRVRCEKALKATGNTDAEAASNWLFEHMDDPDIDAPDPSTSGTSAAVDDAAVEQLGAMGFSAGQARKALRETAGDLERAVDWLFSHPDAGADDDDDAADAQPGQAAGDLPGSPATPANFKLRSIVCHKGSSIHAG